MNRINPTKLKGSKWTAVSPQNKEKHFIIGKVFMDELDKVMSCKLEAIVTGNTYKIDWQILRDESQWLMGWK